MPQSSHDRAAELHNLAIHAHEAAAAAHDKGDHLAAHELTKRALEYSMNVYGLSEKLAIETERSSKTGREAESLTPQCRVLAKKRQEKNR